MFFHIENIEKRFSNKNLYLHSVHWGINYPPQPSPWKTPPLLFLAKPPFLDNLPYILVFCEPPPKTQIFLKTSQNIKDFHPSPHLIF